MRTLTTSVLLGFGATLAIGCGGRTAPRSSDADGGTPEAGGLDSESPPCPATYADVPQGPPQADASCPTRACSYDGQFTCFCDPGAGWECTSSNCICASGQNGCVNAPCNSDANCPSGQHCAPSLGSSTDVCSVGCELDASCPVGATCKMFVP
jgi:hypothetical protein